MTGESDSAGSLWTTEELVLSWPIAMASTDAGRRVVFCNSAFERMFLFRGPEALGSNLEELVGLHESAGVAAAAWRLAQGEYVHLATRARRRDGVLIDIEFHGIPVRRNGVFAGYWAMFQDVTEALRVAQALRVSQEMFWQVFRASPTTVTISTAGENRLIDVNDSWIRLTGYKPHESLGHTPLELGLFQDPDDFARINHEVDIGGGSLRGRECRFRMRDGSPRIGSVSIEQFNVDGKALRITVIADITAVSTAEASLSIVSQALIEAQEAERLRIARELHDDIGQRLTVWLYAFDRLQRDIVEPSSEVLAQMQDLRKQVSGIERDLRALSYELHAPTLSLLTIGRALRRLCIDVGKRLSLDISFSTQRVPSVVPKEVSLCLFRVLQEALSNTAKHSGTRHTTVKLWGAQGRIHLRISDFGKGLSAETLEKSQGMGLVTMRERVALVRGTFAITSLARGGTQIEVSIPLTPPDPPDREAPG